MAVEEFTIALRIRHPSIEPGEITRTLGLEPRHSWKAGEDRRSPAGKPLGGAYRESCWMGVLAQSPEHSSEPVNIETALLQTLAQLRRSRQFLAKLKGEGGEVEIHISIVGHDTFRLELSAEALANLGRLGLAIAIDVEPHADEE